MLLKDIHERRNGLRFYGLTPPKRGQDPARIRDIAARQAQRIAALNPDGLILYDLQDEAGRTAAERPFPFLPTLEPMEYARDFLADLPVPRILYKCVANQGREEFLAWSDAFAGPDCRDAIVLVGAPTGRPGGEPALSIGLGEAYGLLQGRTAPICYGGVAIAERHARKHDEDERLLAKHAGGCRFFISQTVYDPGATKSLLSDYALRFARAGLPPVPFILSFSPCGSLKTMEFMKWLGISFPRWLENELRHSPDILRKSVDLAEKVFADIRDFAAGKGLPIGVNVESVSIRKEEVEASCELFARLSAGMETA
ncbi:MAG TPA: 5,10-methylenetetrahydrofolate reductase [Fibrobacteria bacterium]|nr:5,10-methylenetetrahydrofolate reductase [Fibrobacteria bacterium]